MAARRRIFRRVIDDVGGNLGQPDRIAENPQRLVRELYAHAMAFLFDERLACFQRVAEKIRCVDTRPVQVDLAETDPGDFKKVVDKANEMIDLTLRHIQQARLRIHGSKFPFEHIHGIADRSERVAQFMRQGGEELVLAAVGFLQRGFGLMARRHVGMRPDRAKRPSFGISLNHLSTGENPAPGAVLALQTVFAFVEIGATLKMIRQYGCDGLFLVRMNERFQVR